VPAAALVVGCVDVAGAACDVVVATGEVACDVVVTAESQLVKMKASTRIIANGKYNLFIFPPLKYYGRLSKRGFGPAVITHSTFCFHVASPCFFKR